MLQDKRIWLSNISPYEAFALNFAETSNLHQTAVIFFDLLLTVDSQPHFVCNQSHHCRYVKAVGGASAPLAL